MDWSVFSATFITIFIAEIGDKTQFAAFAAASQTNSTYSVLIATILALTLAAIIGVTGGAFLGKLIDPEKMRFISGGLFILMGSWIILRST